MKEYISKLFINFISRFSRKPVLDNRITGLPNLVTIFPWLEDKLGCTSIGLVYIDIKDFKNIEDIYGGDVCSKILRNIGDTLKNKNIDFFGPRRKIAVCSLGGDDFIIFIDAPVLKDNFEAEYLQLKEVIEARINQVNQIFNLYKPLSIHLGYTELKQDTDANIEKITYQAIKDASFAAKQYADAQVHAKWRTIRQIIEQKQIKTVYQPIFSLKTGAVLGYEALSRGPAGVLEAPSDLFALANQFGCLQELENLCHATSLQGFYPNSQDAYLFVNINPLILNQNNYDQGLIQNVVRDSKLKFSNVVLELTERTEIDNYVQLRETLRFYRQQGFVIAIDDAGSGYSSLTAIAELQPEFVKIDMTLIRDVDKSPTKKALLETMVDFCSKVNARIICEGIETEEELNVLCNIGCDYGQGFLLARPGDIQPKMNMQIREKIIGNCSGRTLSAAAKKIGDIAMINEPVSPSRLVDQVLKSLKENKFNNGMVVCQDQIPLGLVMRERLFNMMSTRYGYDLFINRPISEIMDRDMLVLPWNTSLEEAAVLVAERLERGSNDYIIITRDDTYYGIVSNARLLDTMAKIHIENAQDANPLTGLPGNRCITSRLIKELEEKRPMMVMYFDLDNFKSFNDYFGFEHGDQALVMLANIIKQAVGANGHVDNFVGHIGGDDFIVITEPARANLIAEEVISLFSRQITELYSKSDLELGYIVASNRQGQTGHIPIMSVSIAGVNSDNHNFANHLQISETAAEVKKMAKNIPGSCFVVDRRQDED